jgi:hypothetical protein
MTFAIRPADDLGAMPATLAREHLTLDEVNAWLDEHEDVGTLVILDDRDNQPACGYDLGIAGGAQACDCGRPTCGGGKL